MSSGVGQEDGFSHLLLMPDSFLYGKSGSQLLPSLSKVQSGCTVKAKADGSEYAVYDVDDPMSLREASDRNSAALMTPLSVPGSDCAIL